MVRTRPQDGPDNSTMLGMYCWPWELQETGHERRATGGVNDMESKRSVSHSGSLESTDKPLLWTSAGGMDLGLLRTRTALFRPN